MGGIGKANSFVKTLKRVYSEGCGGDGRIAVSSLQKQCLPSSSFCTSSAAAAAATNTSTAPLESSSSINQGIEKKRGARWSKWLLFVPGAITFGLGTWQVLRRQDKIKMLEYRQNRLAMEPMRFNDISPSSEDLNDLEFSRVSCKGVYDEKRSIFVGPRSRSISGVTVNGYYVITPLMPVPGNPESLRSPILVNRGWVPRDWKDKSVGNAKDEQYYSKTPQPTQESEQGSLWRFWSKKPKIVEDKIHSPTLVEVVGVIRGSEKPSIFVPENEPQSGQWFYVDVSAIARACGLPESIIYVEDINQNTNPSNPYPVPKDVNSLIRSSVMPQDHLNYTLTWYSLSAAVTFMAYKRLRPKRNRS